MPTQKQVTLLGNIAITKPDKEGVRAIVIDTGDGDVYIIPLDQDVSKQLGRDLTAPSVEIASVIPGAE